MGGTTEPVPFRQFVLKMHSRCDLACDHCYVYEHADTSWRGRPMAASDAVLAKTAERIAEHVRRHRLPSVQVVLHGGEPLLAGRDRLGRAAKELRRALDGSAELDLRIHTNGVLLDEEFCELFLAEDIKVGVSLDGDKAANDLHRRYANGRSSHEQVLRAVELLRRPRYRRLYAGLLCTIDVRNDPVAVYDALAELDPPRIDFLLPHATWDTPPLRPEGGGRHPYADWLLTVYDRWSAAGRPMTVRLLESVERTLRGASSLTESLGLEPADLVVIETDGALEQADSLKTAYDGAPATGLDVFSSDVLEEAARHPGVMGRQLGLAGLSEECRSCPVVRSCGGGLYAHRYRTGSGFDNPSVYCADLFALVRGIEERSAASAAVGAAEPVEEQAALSETEWAELAAGQGGAETVRRLAAQQLEINRALVAAVWLSTDGDAEARTAWELIEELDARAPGALDEVLAHPYTRAWAYRCRTGGDPGGGVGGLAELAAAAAVRAGAAEAVPVPVRRGGALRLPGLGRLLLDRTHGHAELSTTDGGLVADGERIGWDDPRWQPVRRVQLDGWEIAVEDTDPERDVHDYTPAERLDVPEFTAWQQELAQAWSLVRRGLPGYAPGLSAGLRMVTPLRGSADGRDISAAARHAFGTAGFGRPGSAETLALLLVHEFQHVKLGALVDLADLFDPEDEGRYFAPWRPDPRPIEGLLQGTYAHLAVVEHWLARMRALPAGPERDRAEREFCVWRSHTAESVETLLGSGALTGRGLRFAEGMAAAAAPWLEVPVARGSAEAARRAAERTRDRWLARAAAGGPE